ncbi:MAG: xylulokinase [Alphaproteobacteria bacterium]|nr:xylulokinase [Alphaproteobacteria bacterium]
MTAARILGIDLGAGSLKATVIDESGATMGEASAAIDTASPKPGWAEQDPDQWWQALQAAVRTVIDEAGIDPAAIAGVGISAGAHIAVLTASDGRVLRPAIMWSDQRSAAEAEELHAAAGERIIRTTLNKANPTWALSHLLWIKRHQPEAFDRCERLYLAKDHLRARLTGDWTTDFSDVLGALMADAATRDWSAELCALVGWPVDRLPPVREPVDVAGQVTAEAARLTGLKAGTPVVVGSNDTTVELYGAGATAPGSGAIKLATAGVVFLTTDRPEVHPPVSCYPHIIDGMWYMASGINACATAHRWVRDVFFGDLPTDGAFAEMDRLAAAIEPGSDGLLFHPYLVGERAPHWDPKLRASLVGLGLGHGRGHVARACYEGISFALYDVLRAAQELSGAEFGDMRLLGGGARSNTWRQILADITGLAVNRPRNGDASFGAALVAGVGVGVFASKEDAIARCVRIVDSNRPDQAVHAFYRERFEIFDQVRRQLTPINHRLHDSNA